MQNFKYIFRENKTLIMVIGVILICSISIAIGVYAQITSGISNKTKQEEEKQLNYEELENEFNYIFTNNINKEATARQNINYDEIIYCKYNINKNEENYIINAKIPLFKIENDITKKINKEIYNTFAKTIINITKQSKVRTTFNVDYVVYVNNNILSLVIKCEYKDGSNPQRKIIETYNYDIDNNKLVDINEILKYKNLNKEDVQKTVLNKIKEENAEIKTISEQGYNVYVRDENDELYKIENATKFFVGKNNYLYLVYAYGNNNYTSVIDLVIF